MSDKQKNSSFDAEQDLNNEAENIQSENVESIVEPESEVFSSEFDEQLSFALEEATKYKEAALRAQADVQNIRRRADLDIEKAHKFGLEKFAKEVIVVADNLERALSSTEKSEGEDLVREGVELTLKSLVETLSRFEVKAVDPHGEPFSPDFHQAITMVPNPDLEPNTVMDVIQKGYTLHGRLLRPAMVVVSSAA
ncbi:nucleotide exchange factor GrpE [Marinomonas sp. 2405UD68-3]|uniref:nucleotide exchange factor GrpE n=1 Tax=Marinomonas sp. 2405UD68-3 TaxID=3391835 RepID=UPI0039C917D5